MKFIWDPAKEKINIQNPNGKILIVVHTFKKIDEIEVIRIISSRKAIKKETKKYLERRR